MFPATTDPVACRSTSMPPADFQVLVGVGGDDTWVQAFLEALPWVRQAPDGRRWVEPLPCAWQVAEERREFLGEEGRESGEQA